jgi:MFS family permease
MKLDCCKECEKPAPDENRGYIKEFRNRNLALLSICQTFLLASSMTLITFSVLIGQMIAPDLRLASLPVAMTVFGAAVCAIPASAFMGRFGRKRGFQLGAILALISGCIAVYAIYHSYFYLFCLATLIHGIYQSFANFYRFTAMEIGPASQEKQAVSYVLGGGLLAAIFAPYLAAYFNLKFEPITFIGAYVFVMILAVIVQIPIYLLKFPIDGLRAKVKSLSDQKTKISYIDILKRPIFLIACLNATGSYVLMAYVMTSAPLAVMACGFDTSDAASVIQWHIFAMFAPAFISGSLIARFGTFKVIYAGMLLFAVAATIGIYDVLMINFYLNLVIVGFAWNFMFVAGTVMLADSYSPSEKSKVQGFNDFILYGFTAAASLTSGLAFNMVGWEMLNYVVYFILLVLFFCTSWYLLSEKRKKQRYKSIE